MKTSKHFSFLAFVFKFKNKTVKNEFNNHIKKYENNNYSKKMKGTKLGKVIIFSGFLVFLFI